MMMMMMMMILMNKGARLILKHIMIYDMIYLLTAIGLTSDGISTVYIYRRNNTPNKK